MSMTRHLERYRRPQRKIGSRPAVRWREDETVLWIEDCDARTALAKGLRNKLPVAWPHVEENAAVEIWLTIEGATAF